MKYVEQLSDMTMIPNLFFTADRGSTNNLLRSDQWSSSNVDPSQALHCPQQHQNIAIVSGQFRLTDIEIIYSKDEEYVIVMIVTI